MGTVAFLLAIFMESLFLTTIKQLSALIDLPDTDMDTDKTLKQIIALLINLKNTQEVKRNPQPQVEPQVSSPVQRQQFQQLVEYNKAVQAQRGQI